MNVGAMAGSGTELPGHVFLHESGLAACMIGLKPVYAGEPREALIKGQFDIASASATTFSKGVPAWFDPTARLAVPTPAAGCFYLGKVTIAKSAGGGSERSIRCLALAFCIFLTFDFLCSSCQIIQRLHGILWKSKIDQTVLL